MVGKNGKFGQRKNHEHCHEHNRERERERERERLLTDGLDKAELKDFVLL